MILIDDAPQHIKQHPENGLLVPAFRGDPDDKWLYTLAPFLEKLSDCEDVRCVNDKFNLHMLGYELAKDNSKPIKKLELVSEAQTMLSVSTQAVNLGVSDFTCFDNEDDGDDGITTLASKQITILKSNRPSFERAVAKKFSFFGSCLGTQCFL
mmetsp:Transcript_13092/g.15036  ORF Transcript_13092/g.15036 Transcript_13092/m.15036 type:complete len:153 (-) Transcript_13092:119-577(-)